MKTQKRYIFLKTLSKVTNVINKVKSLQLLNEEEELVYSIHVKGMSEENALRFIHNKLKIK